MNAGDIYWKNTFKHFDRTASENKNGRFGKVNFVCVLDMNPEKLTN